MRLVANNETIAAIKAARRGKFDRSATSVDELLEDLRADHQAAE